MTQSHVLLSAILFFMLSACTDGSKNPAGSSKSAFPEAELIIIDNEDLSPGLKGIDADGNGVRDDIDRLIAKKYSATSVIKKVAEQRARALQQAMEATTREQAKAAGDEIFRSGDCIFKFLPRATSEDIKFREKMSVEIEALTANTKERFKAYWRGEALSGGMVFRKNQNPICD